MRNLVFLAAVLAVSLAAVPPRIANAQAADTTRGLSVNGTAEVTTAPDIAYVSLGVRTRADQADQAASQNAAAMQEVMAALRRAGIAETEIETVQYTLQPVYEYPPNAPARLLGYEATNLVRVTVRDLTRIGPVIDAAVRAGANLVQDVEFGLRNESEFQARALRLAVENARAKAQVMADALGVRLGNVISATESVGPIVFPRVAMAEAAPSATPISPRQIEVRANVNIVYAIVPSVP